MTAGRSPSLCKTPFLYHSRFPQYSFFTVVIFYENKIMSDFEQKEAPPKITSEVKVKDPRRVAQGKRLAAISREAKARKAREREASIRREEVERCERSERESYSYAVLPVIGVLAIGGGYYLYQRKKDQQPANNDNSEERSEKQQPHLENF